MRGAVTAINLMRLALGDVTVSGIDGRSMDAVFASYVWSQSTRNQKISYYRAFFGWCRSRRYLPSEVDPLFGYRKLRVPEVDRTRIPRSEWSRLFASCVSVQERVIVATGLYLFLRASEQQGIQVQHVHLDDCQVEIYRVKTRQWDTMPISSELDPFLRAQLTSLAELFPLRPDHYLIPGRFRDLKRSPSGQLLAGTGSVNPDRPFTHPHRAIQRILARAGYPTLGEGEHTLRRSGARAYFDELAGSGYDGALRRVQSMLGHSSSAITERYLGLDLDRRSRNQSLRGKPMFSTPADSNVVPIREVRGV